MRENQNDDAFDLEASHIKYKDYRKKVAQKKNESAIMFISAFFIMLLLFLGIAKQLSPDVDVVIGDDETATPNETYTKTSVDERLKLIQMEDAGATRSEDESIFDETLEERVKLPDRIARQQIDEEGTDPNDPLPTVDTQKEAVSQNIVEHPVKEQEAQQPAPTPTVNAKVVVGYYGTAEQAQVAKGILLDAGLNINPFVKQIGGAYTIQVGSYSSREKAQSAANELLRNNFPARVIVE